MTILFDGRPAGYVFDGDARYTNAGTGKSLLLKQEIADGDRPGAYEIVDDPVGTLGHQVWRMTAQYPRDYLAATNKVRCELQPSPTNQGLGTNGEARWYLSTFLLPDDFAFTQLPASGLAYPLILFELHDHPNPPRIQPWCFLLAGDRIELWRATVESGPVADYYTLRLRLGGVAQRGRWHSIVMRAVWSDAGATGEMSIWFNRRLVHRESGANNVFAGATDMYPKNGMYVSHGWPTDWPAEQSAYWGGFVVADGTSTTFDQFVTECGYDWTELERSSGPVGAPAA